MQAERAKDKRAKDSPTYERVGWWVCTLTCANVQATSHLPRELLPYPYLP